MRSTGLVLAAGGIAAANEVIFTPQAGTGALNFNWRIIPATGVLALVLAGIEKVAPDFAVGLAGLTLLAVLIVPVGNAPTPIDNALTLVTGQTAAASNVTAKPTLPHDVNLGA